MIAWIYALILSLVPHAAWSHRYLEIAQAIDEESHAHPLYAGEDGVERTAAEVVAVAFFESHFDPRAVNTKDAGGGSFGLMQVNAAVAPQLGVTREELFDPRANVRAAIRVLRWSHDLCGDRPWNEQLAAYASGRCRSRNEAPQAASAVLAGAAIVIAWFEKAMRDPRMHDLTRQVFDRWTVLGPAEERHRWRVRCACGTESTAKASNLRCGQTRSCGCLHREVTARASTTHGGTRDPIYGIWINMRDRCSNPKNKRWDNYGGRGIRVCASWRVDFAAFRRDMGERPTRTHSIDRIDVNAGYDCGACEDCRARGVTTPNCRWATTKEQCANKRDNRPITYQGRTQLVGAWAAEYGLLEETLRMRVFEYGWTIERALTTPSRQHRTRSTALIVEYQGRSLPVTEWSAVVGLPTGIIAQRLHNGWTAERALSRPLRRKGPHRQRQAAPAPPTGGTS